MKNTFMNYAKNIVALGACSMALALVIAPATVQAHHHGKTYHCKTDCLKDCKAECTNIAEDKLESTCTEWCEDRQYYTNDYEKKDETEATVCENN